MKNSLIFILTLFVFISCSSDGENDAISNQEGSFLTINGDTRELTNISNDPDLDIRKFVNTHQKNGWFNLNEDVKTIGVDIYDPNKVLISNFGDYNIPGHYLTITFVLPLNFIDGDYATMNQRIIPIGDKTFGEFFIQNELNWTSDSGHKVTIRDEGNRYVVEFNNITFENKATISGRIVVNKT